MAYKNRLNLDFSLSSREERVKYARDYLAVIPFSPTPQELEMISKYILWGKDAKTGLNGRQEGLELETRYKTWDSHQIESLDDPAFSEANVRGPFDPPTHIPRQTFSRSLTRKTAPPHILPIFEALWRQIDETELVLNFYELNHARRKNPPRDPLVARFTAPEQEHLQSLAAKLNSYTYLKLRHELVELRREQYNLRDEYAAVHPAITTFNWNNDYWKTFDADINVLPVHLGVFTTEGFDAFGLSDLPTPDDFSERSLRATSQILWTPADTALPTFDFSNPDHLYELYKMWDALVEEAQDAPYDSQLKLFLDVARLYRKLAALDDIQNDILDLKIRHFTNQDIVDIINPKYEKSYRPNYISTLYCKKCLANIAAAASNFRENLENCAFPENFKRCKDCGRLLLINENNFVRRHRSSDGFSPRCKQCEKLARKRS